MKNVTIARLNTLVTANAAQFTREMDRASSVAKSRGMSINDALGKIGMGLSIAGVIAFGKSVIDLAGNIQDLSMQANLTPRGLQAIANVAMDSGVSMEDVARASEKMRSKLQDALANGTDPMNESLRKLGLSAQGLSALNMEQKWEVISRRLVNAKNQQEAMNIASALFGEKIGPRMRETLSRIAQGMEQTARANAGLIITDDQIQQLDEVGDRFGRLWKMSKVLGANAVAGGSEFSILGVKFKGGRSFQDDWKTIKAGFGFNTDEANPLADTEADKRFAIVRDEAIRTRMLKAEQDAQEKNLKDYWQKVNQIEDRYRREKAIKEADPFYKLQKRKMQEEWKDKVSELYTSNNPALAGLVSDLQRGAPDVSLSATPTDQFSRIGGMSAIPNTRVDSEPKKQTEHLRAIEATLKLINDAVRSGRVPSTPAAFSN